MTVYLKVVLVFVFSFLLFYGLAAFIALKFDPLDWPPEGRFLFVFFSMAMAICAVIARRTR
jgi:hypothetical protein